MAVAQPRGQPGHLPPPPLGPSAIRQALGKDLENVHIKPIKGKMVIYNYRVDKDIYINILIY